MKLVFLSLLILTPLHAAITSIGSTGALDRARKFQERVAVPGHDDSHAWSSSFDLGASLSRGNTENQLITASITIDKDFGKNEFFGNFTYAYGETNNQVTEDEFIMTTSLSRLIDDAGLKYYGVRLDGQHDELADIQYRFTLSTFYGHYLIKRPDDSLQISIEAGFGYSAESQGEEEDQFGVLYAGQRFNYWITEFTRLYQGIAIFDQIDDIRSFQIIAEAGLETFLSDSLSFKTYIQNQHESVPAANRKRNDLRLVTGLSYKF